MKKVDVRSDETVVRKEYLERMEKRAQAEYGYRMATLYMNGYMEAQRRGLRNEKDPVRLSRIKGRVDAITAFDEAVVRYARES